MDDIGDDTEPKTVCNNRIDDKQKDLNISSSFDIDCKIQVLPFLSDLPQTP